MTTTSTAREPVLRSSAFGPEDRALLERLEDELVLERVFRHDTLGVEGASRLSPRSAGLVALARATPDGQVAFVAARDGNPTALSGWLATWRAGPPEIQHHLALYFAAVARALEEGYARAASEAWGRSLRAWLWLEQEHAYITHLEESLRGPGATSFVRTPPFVLWLDDLEARARAAAPSLAHAGHAAMLALAASVDVARDPAFASLKDSVLPRVSAEVERRRSAVLDASLAPVREGLEHEVARAEEPANLERRRDHLFRTIAIWGWSGYDVIVEQFVVEHLVTLAFALYRAKAWRALEDLLLPFSGMIEHFAARIARDPSAAAYAASCAQVFVFFSDVAKTPQEKRAHAERALAVCPSHRNGRVVLATLLCREATSKMQRMSLFSRGETLEDVGRLLERAEELYPRSSELERAKQQYASRKGRPR